MYSAIKSIATNVYIKPDAVIMYSIKSIDTNVYIKPDTVIMYSAIKSIDTDMFILNLMQ